jgi:hypothetical protein
MKILIVKVFEEDGETKIATCYAWDTPRQGRVCIRVFFVPAGTQSRISVEEDG